MTKEEIFNKHSWAALGAISPSKEYCLPAMQEYADQQAKPLVDLLNEWSAYDPEFQSRFNLAVLRKKTKKALINYNKDK